MQPLDGNAVAGTLFEHFGDEMTQARGSCVHCGATTQIAELRVYPRAPGAVVRCPSCGSVVIVLTEIRSTSRIHLSGLQLLPAEAGDSPTTEPF